MITLPIIVGTIAISTLIAAGFEPKEVDDEKPKKKRKMKDGIQDAYVEKRMTRRNRCGYYKLDAEKRK